MMAAIVDTGALLEVVWVSLVAGVSVTAIYAFALLAGTRFSESRRAGNAAAAAGFGVLAGLAALLFVAGVVLAVRLILTG